jgi:hypothetical protein
MEKRLCISNGNQYQMMSLKIISLFLLFDLMAIVVSASDYNPRPPSNLRAPEHSIVNMNDIFLSGSMIGQTNITETRNLTPKLVSNEDLEKILFSLDPKGIKDLKDCSVHLTDKKFNFSQIDTYTRLLARIDTVLNKNSASSKPPKDQCFELLQFIF